MTLQQIRENLEQALHNLEAEKGKIDSAMNEARQAINALASDTSELKVTHLPQQAQEKPENGRRKRGQRGWTPEARKAASERMKQVWASRKRGE